jgi:hypothetical protein
MAGPKGTARGTTRDALSCCLAAALLLANLLFGPPLPTAFGDLGQGLICTAHGASSQPADPASPHSDNDCPICLLHCHGPVGAPAVTAGALPLPPAAGMAWESQAAQPPHHPGPQAGGYPRAPPTA